MKLSEILEKHYVMAMVGSEMVGFDIPDPPDQAIHISFTVDGQNHEQYFNDQDVQLLDAPLGGFFVIDVDGKECGFIALTGTALSQDLLIKYAFAQFMLAMRARRDNLIGTDAQIATLISDGLQILQPDTDAARHDASALAFDFTHIASIAGGTTDYPDEPEDANPAG